MERVNAMISVLYVDDEPDLLEIGKIFLEMKGDFIVDTLTSAKQALIRMNTDQFDAIVSDYQMPEIDGITFLKDLKASGNTTPFIIFTGRGREEVVIDALNNGADFYIQKGGDPESQFVELSNKIRYAVSRKQYEVALGVSEVLEKEMEYHEMELIKFYNETLDATNKKLKLLSGVTRNQIIGQLKLLQENREKLEKDLPEASTNELLNAIRIATERISSIIRFTWNYEEDGIDAPVWANIHAMVDAKKRDGIAGRIQIVNDLPSGIEVLSDALITYVFDNLMENALHYGGKIMTLRFSAEDSGDSCIIVCDDDGEGAPDEDKDKRFDRESGKNSNLGLALSQEILDITGITLKETRKPGKGYRFEITVPKGRWRSETVRGPNSDPET